MLLHREMGVEHCAKEQATTHTQATSTAVSCRKQQAGCENKRFSFNPAYHLPAARTSTDVGSPTCTHHSRAATKPTSDTRDGGPDTPTSPAPTFNTPARQARGHPVHHEPCSSRAVHRVRARRRVDAARQHVHHRRLASATVIMFTRRVPHTRAHTHTRERVLAKVAGSVHCQPLTHTSLREWRPALPAHSCR